MARALDRYLVSGRTRSSLDPWDVGGNDRLLAVVATPSGSAQPHRDSALVAHVLGRLLDNTTDRADSIDLAVRRFEHPFSAEFTRARVPALLRAANAQLREMGAQEGTHAEGAIPPISAAVMTTCFGAATIAYVGNLVAIHRIRAGQVQRLTEDVPSAELAMLGTTDAPDVREREVPIEPEDLFVLSEYAPWDTELATVLGALAEEQRFDAALINCFRAVQRESWRRTLMIGRCT